MDKPNTDHPSLWLQLRVPAGFHQSGGQVFQSLRPYELCEFIAAHIAHSCPTSAIPLDGATWTVWLAIKKCIVRAQFKPLICKKYVIIMHCHSIA